MSQTSGQVLERIFSTTHFCIVYLDKDFNFIRVNPAYALTGKNDPEFFVGKNHFALYPNEENEVIFRNVVKTGERFTVNAKPFEFPDQPERGVTYWDWTLEPVLDNEGKTEFLIFILVEVTERVRAEQELKKYQSHLESLVRERTKALEIANKRLLKEIEIRNESQEAERQSNERFRLIMGSNMLPMFFWKPNGSVYEANEAFLKLLGYSEEDLYSDKVNWRSFTPEEFKKLDRRALEEVKTKGSCMSYEKRIICKNGKTVPVLMGAALFETGDGIAYALDLTVHKKLEALEQKIKGMKL